MNIIGWLIVNEFLQTNKFNEIHAWLVRAAKKQGIELQLKTNAQLPIDLPQEHNQKLIQQKPDFILFWDKDTRLAGYLEQAGYPVFNSSDAIAACDDKSLTHLKLTGAGIPMPRTIIAPKTFENIGYTNLNFLPEVSERLGFPLVVKECFGSFGQQVYLAGNMEELKRLVTGIGAKPMLFQEYIASSKGKDVRLQMVGGKVIASMLRYSEQGDFRANLTIGGRMEPYEPSEEQCELAVRCCEILGLSFGGVDLLFGKDDKPLVCEVNSNAHFKNIFDCTGVNAADAVIAYIRNKIGA